uniref:Uncharacterized protein n=1 Tax=uncultured Desulfobacterium sp. TaxID=201089 RepID=E1YMQ5_9BACT|nr:unknown protein [uncultured Desulfobacterium sp.]
MIFHESCSGKSQLSGNKKTNRMVLFGLIIAGWAW